MANKTQLMTLNWVDELSPKWLRSPMWRWQRAVELLTAPRRPLMEVEDDDVALAAHHLRLLSPLGRDLLNGGGELLRPEIPIAFRLHADTGMFGASRWLIEGLITAGFNDAEINEQLPLNRELGARPYEVYRKLFYDIDDYIDRPLAVQAAVFATSAIRSHMYSDCDLTWKLLAYRLKDQFLEFLEAFPTGNFSPDVKKMLRDFNAGKLLYYNAHTASDLRNMLTREAMELLSVAKGSWDITPEADRDLATRNVEDSISELISNIKVTVMGSHTLLNRVEQLNFTKDMRALEGRVAAA